MKKYHSFRKCIVRICGVSLSYFINVCLSRIHTTFTIFFHCIPLHICYLDGWIWINLMTKKIKKKRKMLFDFIRCRMNGVFPLLSSSSNILHSIRLCNRFVFMSTKTNYAFHMNISWFFLLFFFCLWMMISPHHFKCMHPQLYFVPFFT